MSTALPIFRSDRRRDYAAALGQTVFSLDVPVFDLVDVVVSTAAIDDAEFAEITAGISKVFVGDQRHVEVTFAVPPRPDVDGAGFVVRVESRRIEERVTNATRGGIMRSAPLETDLDRNATVDQELRRDVDDVAERALLLNRQFDYDFAGHRGINVGAGRAGSDDVARMADLQGLQGPPGAPGDASIWLRGDVSRSLLFGGHDGGKLLQPESAGFLTGFGEQCLINVKTGDSTTAIGSLSGWLFGPGPNPDPVNLGRNPRACFFGGHRAGSYADFPISCEYIGAFSGEGFYTDVNTGLDISGSRPIYYHDSSWRGEAAGLWASGDASNDIADGFNCFFSMMFAKNNVGRGVACGYSLTGIEGDIFTECFNVLEGHSCYAYGKGDKNNLHGGVAGLGERYPITNGLPTQIGDKHVFLDMTDPNYANFAVGFVPGGQISQGGTFPPNTKITFVDIATGRVDVDKACFNDITPGFTFIGVPLSHTGTSLCGYGHGVLSSISGTSSFDTAVGNAAGAFLEVGNDNDYEGRSTGVTHRTGNGVWLHGPTSDVPAAATSNFANLDRTLYMTSTNSALATVGRVGIKTASPAATLDVAGGIALSANIVIDTDGGHVLRPRTVATLGVATVAGKMFQCTDLSGGAGPVIANGTIWQRMTLAAV